MRRYWLKAECLSADRKQVVITGDELHHIRDVCRQRMGDKFEVLVGGRALLVEISSESKRESLAEVLSEREIEPLPLPRLRLVLSIPRFSVFETVLEKSVELGVEAVHPVFSDNSFIKTNEKTWSLKQDRFAKIVQGATQQCGRGELMPIEPVEKLSDLLAREFVNRDGATRGLFAYEGSVEASSGRPGISLKDAIREMRSQAIVWMFVGGEGGYSRDEVALFRQYGLGPSSFGRQVLRVETACVTLVSILKYELDLMR